MQDIKNFTLGEFGAVLKKWGLPPFHARQVFAWIYKKGVEDFSGMSDISLELKRKLGEEFFIRGIKLLRKQLSYDGTEKFLLGLGDGNSIEAVSIPSESRTTGCISTQVGCKFACAFCASGLLGFKRNLTCGEIIAQAVFLKDHSEAGKLTHLVFMGTGEPLDNYDNVIKAIRIINSKEALNLAARRITVSTAGIIPGIKRLSEEGLQIELSVSLHCADNKTRSQLLPVNKKYPLPELVGACREYVHRTNRQVTLEYVLLHEFNSDLPSAEKLCTIVKEIGVCKVNLIAANPIKALDIEQAVKLEMLMFKDYLVKRGVAVTLRKSRGKDIDAACGQLKISHDKT